MQLELTGQESRDLIWHEGDFIEVIPGTLTVSIKRQDQPSREDPAPLLFLKFFHDSPTAWGEREWNMFTGGEIPNGPALLLVYRSTDRACPFGIVSMSNRAWTHTEPLTEISLYKSTQRYADRRKARWRGYAFLTVAYVILGLVSIGVGSILALIFYHGSPKFHRWAKKLVGIGRLDDDTRQVRDSARVLMHRISKSAEHYWQDEGGGSKRL